MTTVTFRPVCLALGDPFPALSDGGTTSSDDEADLPFQNRRASINRDRSSRQRSDVENEDNSNNDDDDDDDDESYISSDGDSHYYDQRHHRHASLPPAELERRLATLSENLTRTTSMLTQAESTLDALIFRSRDLVNKVNPVQAQSALLSAAKTNVASTADRVDDVLSMLTAAERHREALRRGPHGVADAVYLSEAEEVSRAVAFLEAEGKGFRSYERAVEALQALVEKTVPFLEGDVEKLVVDGHAEQVKVAAIASEAPRVDDGDGGGSGARGGDDESIRLMPEKVFSQLNSVTQTLRGFNRHEYISKFCDARAKALDARVKELAEAFLHGSGVAGHQNKGIADRSAPVSAGAAAGGKDNSIAGGGGSVPSSSSAPTSSSSSSAKHHHAHHAHNIFNINLSHMKGGLGLFGIGGGDDSKKKAAEAGMQRYIKGTHGLIRLLRIYIGMLRGERSLADDIIEQGRADSAFASIVGPSLTRFTDEGRKVLTKVKRQGGTRLLIVLDLTRTFNADLSSFRAAVGAGHEEMISQFMWDLTDAVRKAISHMEEDIQGHSVKSVPHDGTVHALTSNTVTQLKRALEYERTLESHLPPPPPGAGVTAVGQFLRQMFSLLDDNIQRKCETYTKAPLRWIFHVNNAAHVLRGVLECPQLLAMLGGPRGEFVSALEAKIEAGRKEYRMATWYKAVRYLDLDVLDARTVAMASTSSASSSSASLLSKSQRHKVKACFSGFNEVFHELYFSQKAYTVPEADLRGNLREDSKNFVLPKYKEFYDRYAGVGFTQNKGKYVKYSPEVLGEMLGKFFEFSS